MKVHSKAEVEVRAGLIKDHFIPKDENEKSFSFHFTIPPHSHYKVDYERDEKGIWHFVHYEPAVDS